MKKKLNIVLNTVCHITIDSKARQWPYIIAHIIMVFQTVSCISNPASSLHLLVKWFDPTTYLPQAFTIILSTFVIGIFLFLLIIKLFITQNTEMLIRPTTQKTYLANWMLHMQIICKNLLIGPLIRSSLLSIINNKQNISILSLAIINLILFLTIVLPISLFNTSNTFILTPQINKKLNYLNSYLVLVISRVFFAIASVTSDEFILCTCIIFVVVCQSLNIKQPVVGFHHQKAIRAMINCVIFASICRIFEFILGSQQSILLELFGSLFFILFMNEISRYRINKILSLQKPTITQIQIVQFMIENRQQWIKELTFFILRHHKLCQSVSCRCDEIVKNLSKKNCQSQKNIQYQQILLYEFLLSFIQDNFNFQLFKKLSNNQSLIQSQKYIRSILDLAEINLFKLKKRNKAYYLVQNLHNVLESKQIYSISFKLKKKIINFYIQDQIYYRYRQKGVVNTYADSYLNFQVAFQNYKKLLLRSAQNIRQVWIEMNKRQPYGDKIIKFLREFNRCNLKIKTTYRKICNDYQKCESILQDITKSYQKLILNISQRSQFSLLTEIKKECQINVKDEKVEKISQNLQYFSYQSQTPMCFVSIEEKNFGQIIKKNCFFNNFMELEVDMRYHMNDFIIPEHQENHLRKMKNFISDDNFCVERQKIFLLSGLKHLVFCKILIQIIPSITQGFSYAFFIKKIMKEKIIALRNNSEIAYLSKSIDINTEELQIVRELQRKIFLLNLKQMKDEAQREIQLNGGILKIRWIHQLKQGSAEYTFVQVCEQFYTKDSQIFEKGFTDSPLFKISQKINQKSNNFLGNTKFTSHKDPKIQDEKLAKQKELEKQNLKNIFKIIVTNKPVGLIKKTGIVISVLLLLLLGLYIAFLISKLQNQKSYILSTKINQDYQNFMMQIIQANNYARNTNFYMNIGDIIQSQIYLEQLKNKTSINYFMDRFVDNFNVTYITQNWIVFTYTTNKLVTGATQNNFQAISNHIQGPVTNLANANLQNYTFAVNKALTSQNLSRIQSQYFQLSANSLYSFFPKLVKLKTMKVNPIINQIISTDIPMILVLLAQIVCATSCLLLMFWLNRKISILKQETYHILQRLNISITQKKDKMCEQFISRYTLTEAELDLNDKKDSFLKSFTSAIYYSNHQNNSRELNLSRQKITKHEKIHEQNTERELNSRNISSLFNNISKQINDEPKNEGGFKIKRKQKYIIFKQKSCCKIFTPYLILLIILLTYFCLQVFFEIKQVKHVRQGLQMQEKMHLLQIDISLARLYAYENGIYQSELQFYNNISLYLNNLISQMYDSTRSYSNGSLSMESFTQSQNFLKQISYGNLCSYMMFDKFNNQHTAENCSLVSQSILTKGFYATILYYLQSVNTLLLLNSNTKGWTNSQILSYLSTDYFISSNQLIPYIDFVCQQFVKMLVSQLISNLKVYTRVLSSVIVILIAFLFFPGILILIKYIKMYFDQVSQIRSIMLSISYETIIQDIEIFNKFKQNLKSYKSLK